MALLNKTDVQIYALKNGFPRTFTANNRQNRAFSRHNQPINKNL
jgi:hypothetical protein